MLNLWEVDKLKIFKGVLKKVEPFLVEAFAIVKKLNKIIAVSIEFASAKSKFTTSTAQAITLSDI